mmetsp:Transcript_16347/g.49022  ORF Transcript_16347/g.49022 Transcript_16347/m.49022 type:complete len:106 (+) Transcript_16347:440-757(+)
MMQNLAKASEIVKTQTEQMTGELNATVVEGYSDDETVCVSFSGNGVPQSCDITSAAYDMGVEAVNQRVSEAMKDGHTKAREIMQEKMGSIYKAIGVPPPPSTPWS